MSPTRTQKKRSPGRPKENKLIRELKVKTWFAAVAKASGKTAYELEKEFAPSYVDRDEFGKHRARLWDKYRLGKTMPTMKERKGGRRPIALLVEDKYPGTLKWLTTPIWVLADLETVVSTEQLRSIYEAMNPAVRHIFVKSNSKPNSIFWRRADLELVVVLQMLDQMSSIDTYTAYLCLIRESLLCQSKINFLIIADHLNDRISRKKSLLGVAKSKTSESINSEIIKTFRIIQSYLRFNDEIDI